MNSISREYVRYARSRECSAWISYDEAVQWWNLEIFARAANGIHYLQTTSECDQPTLRQMTWLAFMQGDFSPRPCRLGQRFDYSMTHGVLALLRHWCDVRARDLQGLVREAYSDEPYRTDEDFQEITAQAEWEGIVYPTHWSADTDRALGIALVEVGYYRLAMAFAKRVGLAR